MRRKAPKVTVSRPSSGKDKKIALLTRERDEALARQIATTDILRIISQSPTDVRPVFDRIVLTAARLLRCDLVFVLLCDGATYRHAAVASPEGPFADLGPTNFPIDPSANFPSRAIVDKKMLHLPDWSRIDLPEHERNIHKMFGVNSALYLPLLRDGECIGLLTLAGKRPKFSGPLKSPRPNAFRDQALIAIENARLFKETKDALEQQTATSEVLHVISSSPGDLQRVFATMLENAVRICDAKFGNIFRWDGDVLHLVATHNTPPAFAEARRRSPLRPMENPIGRMLATKTVIHVADLARTSATLNDAIRTSRRRRAWRRTDVSGCSDVEGERTDRCVHRLPPRSSSVHRQADRAGAELRRTGRHCHREHAAAERTARIDCSNRLRLPTS